MEIGVGIEAIPKGLGMFESHFFQFIQFETPTFLFWLCEVFYGK